MGYELSRRMGQALRITAYSWFVYSEILVVIERLQGIDIAVISLDGHSIIALGEATQLHNRERDWR
jgi:hypothetical protein